MRELKEGAGENEQGKGDGGEKCCNGGREGGAVVCCTIVSVVQLRVEMIGPTALATAADTAWSMFPQWRAGLL